MKGNIFWLYFIYLNNCLAEDIQNGRFQHPFTQNLTSPDNKIDVNDYEDINFARKSLPEDESLRSRHDREMFRNEYFNTVTEDNLNREDLWPRALALESSPTNSLAKSSDKNDSAHQANNTEVLAQVGGTATLSCYTGHISDEVVTWLKRQDDKLLTIGQEVYGNEDRFSASLSHSTKAWELFVKEVQMSDAGQYECQLTTHPPVTFIFTLKVKQAKAVVTGSREVHIEEGSQLALQCQVVDAPAPPVYIFWYHNRTMVNYERKRDLLVHHENFTSSLVVAKVTASDAGTYTCEPHLATSANVMVHVVTGEKPAAMQHGRKQVDGSSASSLNSRQYTNSSSLFLYILFLLLPSIMLTIQNVFYYSSTNIKSKINLT